MKALWSLIAVKIASANNTLKGWPHACDDAATNEKMHQNWYIPSIKSVLWATGSKVDTSTLNERWTTNARHTAIWLHAFNYSALVYCISSNARQWLAKVCKQTRVWPATCSFVCLFIDSPPSFVLRVAGHFATAIESSIYIIYVRDGTFPWGVW